MKKKKRSTRNTKVYFENERALRELSKMRHRDLQRACIVRGLPSEKVVNFDHHKLVSWFIDNFDNSQDDNLLVGHDAWVEQELRNKGYKDDDALMSPALKFSYVGNIVDMPKPKVIKPIKAPVIEKKEKVAVDPKTGIRPGTKKALTYDLTTKGMPILNIIKEVKKVFPGAEEKSIRIWNKRRLKELPVKK